MTVHVGDYQELMPNILFDLNPFKVSRSNIDVIKYSIFIQCET